MKKIIYLYGMTFLFFWNYSYIMSHTNPLCNDMKNIITTLIKIEQAQFNKTVLDKKKQSATDDTEKINSQNNQVFPPFSFHELSILSFAQLSSLPGEKLLTTDKNVLSQLSEHLLNLLKNYLYNDATKHAINDNNFGAEMIMACKRTAHNQPKIAPICIKMACLIIDSPVIELKILVPQFLLWFLADDQSDNQITHDQSDNEITIIETILKKTPADINLTQIPPANLDPQIIISSALLLIINSQKYKDITIQNRYIACFKELIKRGVDINSQDIRAKLSLLDAAIILNSKDLVSYFLNFHHLELNLFSNYNYNPLFYSLMLKAPYKKNFSINRLLEDPRCILNIQNHHGSTPLIFSIKDITYLDFEDLLDSLKYPLQLLQQKRCDTSIVNNKGDDALSLALWNQHQAINTEIEQQYLKIAKDIINHPSFICINNYASTAHSPLVYAIQLNNYDIAKLLVNNTSLSTLEDMSTLEMSIDTSSLSSQEKISLKELIKQRKPLLQNKQGNPIFSMKRVNDKRKPPLMEAIENGTTDKISLLLQDPALDINAEDEYGNTALMYAIMLKNTTVASQILNREDCNINHCNKSQFTPLMLASINNNSELVTQLLATKKCLINMTDLRGQTAAMLAFKHTSLKVFYMLIDVMSLEDFQITNKNNKTLIEIINDVHESPQLKTYLTNYINTKIRELKKPDTQDNKSQDVPTLHNDPTRTPLMSALLHQDIPRIEEIISDPTCNFGAQDANGDTALIIAMSCKADFIIPKLIECMIKQDILLKNAQKLDALNFLDQRYCPISIPLADSYKKIIVKKLNTNTHPLKPIIKSKL